MQGSSGGGGAQYPKKFPRQEGSGEHETRGRVLGEEEPDVPKGDMPLCPLKTTFPTGARWTAGWRWSPSEGGKREGREWRGEAPGWVGCWRRKRGRERRDQGGMQEERGLDRRQEGGGGERRGGLEAGAGGSEQHWEGPPEAVLAAAAAPPNSLAD